jgi:predicted DNA-binding WGR domain protein
VAAILLSHVPELARRSLRVLSYLMLRDTRPRARFYRVEVSYNLFGEYSVLREWGQRGKRGQALLVWFSNLREACVAAERWHKRARRRGYRALEG